MTTPQERRDTIEAILREWDRVPELRLGQLLTSAAGSINGRDVIMFYASDEKLVSAVVGYLDDLNEGKLPRRQGRDQ